MAQTPSKRWEEQVNAVCIDGWSGDAWAVSKTDAIALLSRQHAAFVRMVKALPRYDENKDYHENQQYLGLFKDGRFIKLGDLLAALQQGGKK